MNKVFYLSTCDTCKRILARIPADISLEMVDIKQKNINASDLDFAAEILGSYEALFSKRARKYRAMNLHERQLSEEEIKDLILHEYTFLKRPVFILGEKVFAGNSKKTVDAAIAELYAG